MPQFFQPRCQGIAIQAIGPDIVKPVLQPFALHPGQRLLAGVTVLQAIDDNHAIPPVSG